jgi:hypothetical protein
MVNNMERIGRAKAIRLKCIDCCCGNTAEVRKCPAEHCPLWRFRMGREIKDTLSENNGDSYVLSDDFEDEDFE